MNRAALVALAIAACNGAPAPSTTTTAPPTQLGPSTPSRLETRTFASAALGVEKSVVVYLPANYDRDPAKRYPVFYYLHGLGGNETNWSKGAQLQSVADGMTLDAIVVMPDGDNNFYVDSAMPVDYDACLATGKGMFSQRQDRAATCVRASKYATYITRDLVAWVDASFATIPTREGRAIAGLSMGGFGALSLAMRNPTLYAAAASHSGVDSLLLAAPFPYPPGQPDKAVLSLAIWDQVPGIGPWVKQLFGAELATWQAVDPTTLATTLDPATAPALYLDCGTEDDFNLQHGATYLHDLLAARDIEHAFYLGPGAHDMAFWRERLPHSLKFLRAHVKTP